VACLTFIGYVSSDGEKQQGLLVRIRNARLRIRKREHHERKMIMRMKDCIDECLYSRERYALETRERERVKQMTNVR